MTASQNKPEVKAKPKAAECQVERQCLAIQKEVGGESPNKFLNSGQKVGRWYGNSITQKS